MESFLILGFIVGMGHALETDHLAAIGTLPSSGISTPGKSAFLGASRGIGLPTPLRLIAPPVILFGAV